MSYISDIIRELLYDLADQAAGCQVEDCAGHLIDNCVVADGRVLAFTTSNALALASAIESRLERQQREVKRVAKANIAAFHGSPEAAERLVTLREAHTTARIEPDGTLKIDGLHSQHTWELVEHDDSSVSALCLECGRMAAICSDEMFKPRAGGSVHADAECASCTTNPICHVGILEPNGTSRRWTAAERLVWSHFGTRTQRR